MRTHLTASDRTNSPSRPPQQPASNLKPRPFNNPVEEATVQAQQTTTPDLQTQLEQGRKSANLLSRVPILQPKLSVGEPNDQYEQEADRVASQVMSMATPTQQPNIQRQTAGEEEALQTKPLASTITPLVQRQTTEEEELQSKPIQRQATEEEELQTKPIQRREGDSGNAGANVESQLNSTKGSGSPLSDEVRSFMEPRFGADFSQVRVHTGDTAVQMNRELGAQAFTHGHDIYYGNGKAPSQDDLTAHELTHVLQQTGAVQAKPMIMRQDAGTPTTTTPVPTDAGPTDAGPVAGVPATTSADLTGLPEDLQDFINHGLFGPQALVPPTNIGGFDASYDPQTGLLDIRVKTGVNFNDGLSVDGAGVITANHSDLNQAAIDGMAIPDAALRQSFVDEFVWNDEQKQNFMIDLQARVEGAWSTSGAGLIFTCTRPGWEGVTAVVSVDVDVHEGAAEADDHLQTTVYKVPDDGTYSVGAFVDSDRDDPANARDQDPHNNELVMSSTDVNPTPESQSLLRRSVHFAHDSAVLSADAQNILRGFAADFQDANLDLTNPVQLVGHASSSGSDAYNLQLAQQRIDTVRAFLSSIGFTGINDRVSTDNQGETGAAEAAEWRRVDLIVGSGEGQLVAAHEFGHVFGLDDEYVSNDVNPGGTIGGSGKAVGTAVDHDQMARDIGTSGAIAENNDGIMSLGNTIRGEHYATFGWALSKVTGVTEWQVI